MLALIALVLAAAGLIAVVRLRRSRPLPPADPSEVRRLAQEGSTIQAVAMYRRLTGLGLYDAKQAIDRFKQTGELEFPAPAPAPSGEGDEDVVELVRNHQIVEAIKLYRERHGVDLLAAKNAVDKLAGR
jgi:ribosomal protein L7/L12